MLLHNSKVRCSGGSTGFFWIVQDLDVNIAQASKMSTCKMYMVAQCDCTIIIIKSVLNSTKQCSCYEINSTVSSNYTPNI